MTRTALIASATAAILGSLTLSATAEAGGIRLGFGGPMPSFVATPTHGGGGSYNTSSYGGSPHCAKKQPSYAAASRPHSEPRVAHSQPTAPRRDKVAVADATPVTEKVADTAATTDTNSSSGLTGSKALAQIDNAATTAAATAETAKTETVTVAEAPETAPEAARTETLASTEPAKELGCKKFIPSVGVTIDVGCEK